MCYVKLLFLMYNRCIITVLEENDTYSNVISLFQKILFKNNKLSLSDVEYFMINLIILILINKIIFITMLNYIVSSKFKHNYIL